MTPAVRLALHLGLTEFLRQREELDTKIRDVRAALGETEPAVEPPKRVRYSSPKITAAAKDMGIGLELPDGDMLLTDEEVKRALAHRYTPDPEPAPVRMLPALATPPASDGAAYDPAKPATVAAYLMAMGPGRLSFSATRPRPEWTDAEGVTRRLYLGGDAHNAHKAEGLGIPFGHGLWRGYWLTTAEADRMGAIKRDRAGTRKPAPPPPPVVEDDWRKGRHLVRDAAMVRMAKDLGVGHVIGDVVYLTPLEDGQVRAHLRAS